MYALIAFSSDDSTEILYKMDALTIAQALITMWYNVCLLLLFSNSFRCTIEYNERQINSLG